jgi:hypothetical protein
MLWREEIQYSIRRSVGRSFGTGQVEVEVEVKEGAVAVAVHWACSECFLEMERVGEIMGESEWVKAKYVVTRRAR